LVALLTAALAAAPATPAAGADALYVYDQTAGVSLDLSPELAGSARDVNDAMAKLETVLRSLTDAQKTDPGVLDVLALLAENLARRSVSVQAETGRPLTAETARQQAESARAATRAMELLAEKYQVLFLRELRDGVFFQFEGNAGVQWDDGLKSVGTEQLTLAAPFASLTVDVSGAAGAMALDLRPAGGETARRVDLTELALRYWSVAAMLVLTLVWLAAMFLLKRNIPWWGLAAVCLLAVGLNLTAAGLPAAGLPAPAAQGAAADDSAVTVTMTGVESAVLSIPIEEAWPDEWVVADADGRPAACKYNPVTGTLDARIYESGDYALRPAAAQFQDIKDKSAEMQQAIYMLTSRWLMATPEDRAFLPDREITRAEFLSAVLNAMHLLDEEAENPFPDVLPGDWFSAVAASAYKEKLVEGFEDGTFRGNTPMPKEQMVAITANCLTRAMRYKNPEGAPPAEVLAEYYPDAAQIGRWAESGVALATRAGVVPARADGLFAPDSVMTRGDAAVMMYRLFVKIW
jgi:hypothetical protein